MAGRSVVRDRQMGPSSDWRANSQGHGQSRSAGFQPAVSQGFQPADVPIGPAQRTGWRSADWKSAIQQVGNRLETCATSILGHFRHQDCF